MVCHLYKTSLACVFTELLLAVLCLVPWGFYTLGDAPQPDSGWAFLCFVGKLETTSVCSDTLALGKNA